MSVCTMNPEVAPQQTQETPLPQETPSAKPGRETNGRYGRGNPGGPGNPFGRRTAALRKMAAEAVTDDVMRAVMAVLISKSLAGEIQAIKLLLQYSIGKPKDAVDPDRVDIEEWKLCEESNVSGASGQAVFIDGMPLNFALDLAPIMEEVKVEKMKAQWHQSEVDLAEQQAIDAAEDAAIQRGIEESIRAHREAERQGKVEPRPTMTLDEILRAAPPSLNGANGPNAGRGQTPSPSPNGANGGAGESGRERSPSRNGRNGKRTSRAVL